MKRLHLFEWEDQPWLPQQFRSYLTELLSYQLQAIYLPAVPVLAQWLLRCHCCTVVDLGSGAGGPWPLLQTELASIGISLSILLTDKYPDLTQLSNVPSQLSIRYYPHSVDALAVSDELVGCRTLFTCFHHFRPHQAMTVLRQTSERQVPIAIFEFTERKWSNILGILLSPLLVWLHTPSITPFRWKRLLWTYLVPVIPFLYMWDGLVSHLRTYTIAELQAMIDTCPACDFQWEIGRIKHPTGDTVLTYLIGWKL